MFEFSWERGLAVNVEIVTKLWKLQFCEFSSSSVHISSSMSLKVPLEYSLQSARLGREGEFTGWG